MQKVAQKIVAVMKKCGYVQKDGDNRQQKYKYVSEAAVLGKIQPLLVEQNLIAVPKFSLLSEREKPTQNGAVWQFCTVKCQMTIIDSESGESVVVESLGQGVDPNDKGIAKAQTMAQKYCWMKLLQLETGDDPEKDETADRQQFTQQAAQPVNTNPFWCAPTDERVFVVDWKNDRLAELERLWMFMEWGDRQKLLQYIHQWMGRNHIAEMTPATYETLLKEQIAYLKQSGIKVEDGLPF